MAYWSDRAAKSGGKGVFLWGLLFAAAGLLTVIKIRADAGCWREKSRSPRLLFSAGLLLFFFAAGWGRMAWECRPSALETYLERASGSREEKIRMRAGGILYSWTEQEGSYRLVLSEVTLAGEGYSFEEPFVLVSADAETMGSVLPPVCGGRAEVYGTAELFSEARNPGEFDAQLYYRGKKISCRLWADSVQADAQTIGRPAFFWADRFRRFAREALEEVCCSVDVGIFQAILLGDKTSLPDETEELFQDQGIAHILAVSGLHVSLIGMTLYTFLRRFGISFGMAGALASAVLLFYGSVTGYGASVFRAVFMLLCVFLAGWLGRTYDLLSAMALSLLLLAADSPLLLCSGGLQLSYGSVLAVGLEQERRKYRELEKREGKEDPAAWLERLPWLTETLRVSLAIQLVTLPVQLFHFFRFPPWGIILNLLVIPLMSYAAASGMLAVALFAVGGLLLKAQAVSGWPGVLLLRAAGAVIGPGHYIFALYRELCGLAERLPFSSIVAGRPEAWKLCLYYAALAAWYAGNNTDFWKHGRARLLPLFSALALLFIRPVHGLHVWFLDVGQGDGVVLRTREHTILSDCGSSQQRQVGKWRLVPFLESQGITELDYVLVSHGDSDHINGILWLLEEEEEIPVRVLGLPLAGYGQEAYQELVQAANRRGTEVRYLARGDMLQAGELTVSCLHPDGESLSAAASGRGSDRNSHSLVFQMEYGGFSLLLTGDIGVGEERKLQAELSRQYAGQGRRLTVLKAAHHGSAGSSSAEFLGAVSPQLAVLSYGEGNSYGHPAPEAVGRLLEAGAELWETAESGAIHLVTDGKTFELRGFLAKEVDRESKNGL